MAQSIGSRLNGQKPEEIERLLRIHGPTDFCKYMVKPECTPEALQNWFRRHDGYENFNIYRFKPIIHASPGEISATDIMEVFQNILDNLYERICDLENRNKELLEVVERMNEEAKRRNSLSSRELISKLEPYLDKLKA